MAKRKKKTKRFQLRFPIWKDYTFKEVFSDPEITKAFLESLLGIKIQKLVYVHVEEETRPDGKGRNIRLDIMAMDENGVYYDIEMQGEHLEVIPYRYRANGSAMDARLIPKGMKTNDLKKIQKRYIIFICREDPFDQDLRQYTVLNTVQETGKSIDDKTELICLNASGSKGEVPVDIKAFLDYVKDGTDDGTNAFVHRIHQRVVELNQDEGFVRQGMTLEQKMADKYDDGEKIGIKKGEKKGLNKGIRGTVNILKECGFTNAQILEKICQEYHLKESQAKEYL